MVWHQSHHKPSSEPISIQQNALENFVFEMTSILSRPQCVNCQMVPNWWAIRATSNDLCIWWPTLEPLILPQVWVQMALQNNKILLKIGMTKLVKYMKNWNLIFLFYMSYTSTYSFGANLHCLKWEKLMVPDLATTDFEYCWWFLLITNWFLNKQSKSEESDSCNRPCNFAQIRSKLIFRPRDLEIWHITLNK